MPTQQTPVLIVGAGPTGLTLACELARYGITSRIIDAGNDLTPVQESRALGIQSRTLEVFDAMGMVEPIVQQGRQILGFHIHDRGRNYAHVQFDFTDLETHYPFLLSLSQGETERQLASTWSERGGTIEWQTKLTSCRQDDEGVTASLMKGEEETEVRADWLVGCDGAHSKVRECLGLSFAGFAYPERFLLIDAPVNWDLPNHTGHLFLVPGGLMAALPLPHAKVWRFIDATGASEEDNPTAITQKFRTLLAESQFPQNVLEEPHWASSFHIHRRIVDQLRVRRCFLAGDAAHIHSPVGGQGMNTGIQDAFNLAWKLALCIHNLANESLLDSYQPERWPVMEGVERNTDRATRMVTLRNPILRWFRNQLLKWVSGSRFLRRRLTHQISELGIHYRNTPLVGEDWQGQSRKAPRPGERLPDIPLPTQTAGTQRLQELLRGPYHTLLLFHGTEVPDKNRSATAEEVEQVARNVLKQWIKVYHIVPTTEHDSSSSGDAILVVDPEGKLHQRFAAAGGAVYLIRPDGYVGYRSQPPDGQRLGSYLSRVFG